MSASRLDILDFPLSGNRLIEASAGTGKTYTIAALYLRLVLGHELAQAPLLPPDILVVTFTEAATQELRERIRRRLTEAADWFLAEQAETDDSVLTRLRAAYPSETWPACAHRLRMAANWMDEAAVYTIHGWCNRMLQQHALDSGGLFKQQVDNDDRELLLQAVRDYWRQFFYRLSATACLAVYRLAATPEQLADTLQPLLFETEAKGLETEQTDIAAVFAAWENWETRRQSLENRARQLWQQDKAALEEMLSLASEKGLLNGNLYRKAGFAERLAQLAAWAGHGETPDSENLAKFGAQKLKAGLTKAHQDKAHLFDQAAFQAIDELVEHWADETDIAGLLLRHAVHWIRRRYDGEKRRLAQMTFDDMLHRLDRALQGANGETLAQAIRRQYPIALIDEFQDTDPVQYRIFSRLYQTEAAAELGCFMIGDPKQAIYAFRGGDIFTYLQAHRATQGRHYTLETNFRSTAALVQAVNQVFRQADEQQAGGAFCFRQAEHDPLPFLPVEAKGRKDVWWEAGQAADALTVWHLQADAPIGLPEYRRQLAETTASEIVRLLQLAGQGQTGFRTEDGTLRPLQPADIAILVRSGGEARLMRNALAARQLRSVYLSERESIYASQEAADLLLWLQAMAEPGDERRVRAALASASIGWPYQALQRLNRDEAAWETELERFTAYQQRWQQDGILPALRQLMADYALPARLLAQSGGERSLTNLLHLAELLQQASSRLEGEPALIRHLAEAIADNGRGGDENVVRLESDANLIKIVTIHKSKGLEYPLVFLPFVCGFREVNSRNNRYFRYHDADYALCIDLDCNDDSKQASDRERLQEDLRLLYVALTRAQYACWLGLAPVRSGNGKHCQLEKSAMGYLLAWQTGLGSGELAAKLAQLKGACADIRISPLPAANQQPYRGNDEAAELQPVRRAVTPIADDWWIASYSALTDQTAPAGQAAAPSPAEAENFRADKHGDEADPAAGLPVAGASGIHALPRGAGPGVLVHALLEQCAGAGFGNVSAQPEFGRQLIAKLFNQPAWEDRQALLQQVLAQWLALPLLADAAVCLADLQAGQYQAEMEFLLGADRVAVATVDQLVCQHLYPGLPRPRLLPRQLNGLLKGFIDLVFQHDGRYYLLDYKFNALGASQAAYAPEALTDAMLNKRYDLQAALYFLALHRLLRARLGKAYDYERHIGGGVYLFLRGCQHASAGRVMLKPPKALIDGLDACFAPETAEGPR